MPAPLERGTAAPIMTGAGVRRARTPSSPWRRAVPDSFPSPGTPASVRLPATESGAYVRDAGSDVRTGELALAGGTFLGPGQLGLLAALGITQVTVEPEPQGAPGHDGDEVVEPGRPLEPGKIYDANGTLLEAAMRQAGLDVLRTAISTDDPEQLTTPAPAARPAGRPDRHHRRRQQGRL